MLFLFVFRETGEGPIVAVIGYRLACLVSAYAQCDIGDIAIDVMSKLLQSVLQFSLISQQMRDR